MSLLLKSMKFYRIMISCLMNKNSHRNRSCIESMSRFRLNALIKISEGAPVISRVRIRKTERGKGLGTLLLGHMEEYCFKEGYDKILVDTENHMVAAVKLYEGHNYRRIRESIEKIDGKIYTTYFYEKYL